MSSLSGHRDLFVTGVEDGLIRGIAAAPDEFKEALELLSLQKLYLALASHTEYQNLRLLANSGARDLSRNPASFNSFVRFDFNFDQFEQSFLKRISQNGRLTIDSIGEILRSFYASYSSQWKNGAWDKIIVSKPCESAHQVLLTERFLKNDRPRLLCVVRDIRAIVCSNSEYRSVTRSRIVELCYQWVRHIQAIEMLGKSFEVLVVRYEDICLRTDSTLREVCEYLEVPFEKSLLQTELLGYKFLGNSSFTSHDGMISANSVSRWKLKMDKQDIQFIEDMVASHLIKADYHLEYEQRLIGAFNPRIRYLIKAAKVSITEKISLGKQQLVQIGFAVGVMFGIVLGLLLS